MYYNTSNFYLGNSRYASDDDYDDIGGLDESYTTLLAQSRELIQQYEASIARKLKKIQADMPKYRSHTKYPNNPFECVQFVDRYVSKILGVTSGKSIMGRKVYDIYKQPLPLPAGFTPVIINPNPKRLMKYYGKYTICTHHKTRKLQTAEPDIHGIYRQGPTGRPLALVDRMKFYGSGEVTGLKEGWYLERGIPRYHAQCKPIYPVQCAVASQKTQCKPLEVPGTYELVKVAYKPICLTPGFYRIYTAEGYSPSKGSYDGRHELLLRVGIDNKLSFWGSWKTSDGPEERSRGNIHYFCLRKCHPRWFDRRIVTRIYRIQVPAKSLP